MSVLARKRRRDLWRMRGQVLAVVLVGAVGVANLVMSQATLESLDTSRARYYAGAAFADAFAGLVRAPEAVATRLAAIPGVARVDTRIVAHGRAELQDFDEPIRVTAISLPGATDPFLNRLHLRAGRVPGPDEHDAMVVSDAFAEAHGLVPGDSVTVTVHGRRQMLWIAGIGATPEYVAQMAPMTMFPDARRFAVMWMPRAALAAAVDMEGAFNSVAFAYAPGARTRQVLDDVDRVLARHGGTGAIDRQDQPSHRYLSEEFRQLRTMARIFPAVFLGVSAFVLHVVLGRLVAGQREQIGTLKAFGFDNREVWRHYAGYAVLVGLASALLGLALGAWLGHGMAGLYREFYRLPWVDFRISPAIVLLATSVSLASALLGAALPVRAAARLAPAEAMRPDVPWQGRPPGLVRALRFARMRQSHRLIARNLQRRPGRALLTWFGLALGTAVMMMARFQDDAIEAIIDRQFRQAERHDVMVAFQEARGARAVQALRALPGVIRVEPERVVPVRVVHRAMRYRTVARGLLPDARLRRTIDRGGAPVEAPLEGVLLTDHLADWLDARPGDLVTLETLDGRGRMLQLPLAGVVGEPFGAQAYLPEAIMDRLTGEPGRVTGAALSVDPAALPAIFKRLDGWPLVAGLDQRLAGLRNFREGMADTITTFTLIATAFGIVITVGVLYSSARVSLSERARDLASLRILGFTRAEAGYLLLGELALLTVLAVPLGFALGHGFVALLVHGFESDLVRIPHRVTAVTHGLAGVTTLATALVCGALIQRLVDRLDLVAVLKARD